MTGRCRGELGHHPGLHGVRGSHHTFQPAQHGQQRLGVQTRRVKTREQSGDRGRIKTGNRKPAIRFPANIGIGVARNGIGQGLHATNSISTTPTLDHSKE